jgi:tetratricopeptide (TPR) repeat protein
VHRQRGELDKALEYFEEALSIERSMHESAHVSVAKMLNLIGNIHLQLGNLNELMSCYTEAARIYKTCEQSHDSLVIAGHNFYAISKVCPASASAA